VNASTQYNELIKINIYLLFSSYDLLIGIRDILLEDIHQIALELNTLTTYI